jgi:pimeloyl-ACP methyl ester carboxylesterase
MTSAITVSGRQRVEDMLGLDEIHVTHRSRRMRGFVGGEGTPVVLVHGLGGGAANWVDVVPALRTSHRLLVPDLPGHGGSEPLAPGALVVDYADAVAAMMRDSEASSAVVAGHSFGGHVALRLAERHPELLRGLLLVVTSGVAQLSLRTRALGKLTTRIRPGARVAPLALRLAGRPRFRRLVFSPGLAADGAAISPGAARGFFAELRDHSDVRAAFRATVADRVVDAVDLRCPTLVLWGASDEVVPLAHGIELARLLGAPIRVVADCGHLVPGERPGAVVDAIAALEHAGEASLAPTRGSRPRRSRS